ncbi:MAG: hypothetical protein CM15mV144_060 [Caudoviricetes sp.]|nr:MAG: hypothetical protein CM15mV144_060 [Caudoviricetes sp.]
MLYLCGVVALVCQCLNSGFKPRPEGFVIPDLPQESGAVISPNNSPAAPDSPIVDDEIPF